MHPVTSFHTLFLQEAFNCYHCTSLHVTCLQAHARAGVWKSEGFPTAALSPSVVGWLVFLRQGLFPCVALAVVELYTSVNGVLGLN